MLGNAVHFAPFGEANADEFGAVAGAPLRRAAVALDQPRQHLHDPGGGQRGSNFGTQPPLVVLVEHVEDAKPAAIGEHTAGKIERASLVDGSGRHQQLLDAGGQPLFCRRGKRNLLAP